MHRNFNVTINSLSPVLPSQVLCRLRQRSGCEQADCPPGNILVEQNCEREADLALAIVKIREWIMNSISIFNLKKMKLKAKTTEVKYCQVLKSFKDVEHKCGICKKILHDNRFLDCE